MQGPLRPQQDLIDVVRAGDAPRLRRLLTRVDDVQVAKHLDNLEPNEQVQILQQLSLDRRSQVIAAMRYEVAAQLVARLAPPEAARLVDGLEADDAVDILGCIGSEQLAQILARLDASDADQLESLLAYDENSAGGLMSPRALRVLRTVTVEEALRSLRTDAEFPEGRPAQSFYVYVVDENGLLVGVCSLPRLVTAPAETRVQELMDSDVVRVQADMDQEQVAEVVSRYDLVAVPVVDTKNRLLGVVAVDDVLDVVREEATEDILKMAGAGQQLVVSRSFVASFRVRWRWLLAAAGGGIFAAVSLSSFERSLAAVPALAFFMPVVAGMGGNVGTQSSTIVVRGLAVGFVETARLRRLVVREIGLGLSLGLFYGILIGAMAPFVDGAHDPWRLGAVVAAGTVASTTVAAAVGTCMPLVLDRFQVDPAVATGPFVTTSVDVIGLLLYFWLANVFLGLPW